MITENVTISGKPNFVAKRGVQALDVQERVVWEQKTSPFGNSWQIVRKNVYLDTDYIEEGANKYVTSVQKSALNEANEPSATNPYATLNDISSGFGNIWWVKEGMTVTIEEEMENVVTEMVVDGKLILDGKLTVL